MSDTKLKHHHKAGVMKGKGKCEACDAEFDAKKLEFLIKLGIPCDRCGVITCDGFCE